MPLVEDRAARLFYDDACGPCRLLARAAEGMSHHRVAAVPLASPSADRALGDLSEEVRFGYAHLAKGDRLLTGERLATPLVGYLLGSRIERATSRLPAVERSIRWAYRRLWQFRRQRGCASRAGPS